MAGFVGDDSVAGTAGGTVTLLDADSGTLRTRVQAGSSIRSSATIAGSTAYVGTDDGTVVALTAGG